MAQTNPKNSQPVFIQINFVLAVLGLGMMASLTALHPSLGSDNFTSIFDLVEIFVTIAIFVVMPLNAIFALGAVIYSLYKGMRIVKPLLALVFSVLAISLPALVGNLLS
jgi:hypothetical protein